MANPKDIRELAQLVSTAEDTGYKVAIKYWIVKESLKIFTESYGPGQDVETQAEHLRRLSFAKKVLSKERENEIEMFSLAFLTKNEIAQKIINEEDIIKNDVKNFVEDNYSKFAGYPE